MTSIFSLDKLTEVELADFVKEHFGDTEEYQENKKRHSLINRCKKLIKEQEQICSESREMYQSIEKEQYAKAIFYGKESLKKANHNAYSLRKVLSELGYEEELISTDFPKIKLTGEIEDDILHIVLPDLLPDKVEQGEGRRYSEITYTYTSAFKNFFTKGRFPIYEQKAVLVFINYYLDEQHLKDHDNFETKQIIDILSIFLLPDDNPKWCANYMDYKMGEYNHTEIYVVPYSKFMKFFTKTLIHD